MSDDLHRDIPTIHAHIDDAGDVRFGEGDGFTAEEIIARVKDSLDNPDGVTDLGPDETYPVPEPERFIDHDRMVELEFIDAPDLQVLGEQLIEEFEMDHVDIAVIRYLWKQEMTGTTVGKCIKASGPLRHATGADFIVWVAADHARGSQFTLRQVRALLYHELLHITHTEKGKPAIRKHDAEIFRDELRDFGFWNRELKHVFGQLAMPL